MFAYCSNNPTINKDVSGNLLNTISGAVTGNLIGGLVSLAKGDGFWAGAAQGAVSGAIAGGAVDITIATVATGGVAGVVVASGVAFLGGFGGSLAGDQACSLAKDQKFAKVDGSSIWRAGISGVINVISSVFPVR